LYSPPYLLSALAALTTLHGHNGARARILVQLPGASESALAGILAIVRELASGHPAVEQVDGMTDRQLEASPIEALLGEHYDEFLYAHDGTGSVCRRLAAAYPAARRICIGDALGMIYPADFLAAYRPRRPFALGDWMRATVGAIGLRSRELNPIVPQKAALVLPVDPSGRGLAGLELVCCPKREFLDAVNHCHANARALREYMSGLLLRFDGRKRYLMLTETYAEAGHLPPTREIDMYAEIVRKHCTPGSVVLIKPHPLESTGKAERIARATGGGYEVVGIEPMFGRYPIEVWEELVRGCTVISSAYPVLSLKYTHGIDVVQPMDEAMIERWIDPAFRRWARDSLQLYMEPLERLKSWDGRSVLWPPERA